MSIRITTRLYRNRHGVFYFRLVIPPDLRDLIRQREVRLSLDTEQRQQAVTIALPLLGALPQLLADLRRMADNNDTPPPDYFQKWREEAFKNASLRAKIKLLQQELDDQKERMVRMVPRAKAKQVGKIMHERGQLHGKQELEARLAFPWPPERTVPLSALQAAFLKHLTRRPAGARRKPPMPKTLDEYGKSIDTFITIMGDQRIGAIDREIAEEYFSILRRLPPNVRRLSKYQGKTTAEILDMGDPPQSETNASKQVERLSAMFNWALEEKRKWGIDANPFVGFGQAKTQESTRRPFTSDELRALLAHPIFAERQFPSAYSYWLIPMAIYSGARLGELCQLDIKDFVEIDGIPCIDINDIDAVEVDEATGKRVKTRNAKRLVPIHSELIRLGLLRFVETKRQRQEPHLFPELSRTRRDGPAHAASNWFQRFRAKVGLTEKQATVFHSFRHGFITSIIDAGISPHMLAPIVGHEADLVTGQVYWNKKDATARLPTVEAFHLAADVAALIPTVEEITFASESGRQPARR